jgi:hypothetical protein
LRLVAEKNLVRLMDGISSLKRATEALRKELALVSSGSKIDTALLEINRSQATDRVFLKELSRSRAAR